MSHADLDRLRAVITGQLGLSFDDRRLEDLGEAVTARLADRRTDDLQAYCDHLESAAGREELGRLADRLTVGETYFFRYADQFRAFTGVALPDRVRARRLAPPVRILSAGCASGEEPYSLAIVAREVLGPEAATTLVRIQAIDVSPGVIDRARRARYSSWSLRETTPEIRQRYFQPHGREFLLEPGIRDTVVFERRNLVDSDPGFWWPETFDVVFLRNVIMYFSADVARAVIRRVAQAMAPGGFLFLGHAETLRGLSHDFHLQHTHETFYYQRREAGELERAPFGFDDARDDRPRSVAIPGGRLELGTPWVDAIREASERIASLASQSGPSPEMVVPLRRERSLDLRGAVEMLRQERFGDAIDALGALPPEAMTDPEALLLKAAIRVNAGDLKEAATLCQALLEIDELNAGAHYLMALCREHEGDQVAALDHDRTAIYLDPAFAMPHLHRGLLARRSGDEVTARRELAHAVDLLAREDSSRVLLFGGGFSREALVDLCRSVLHTSERTR